jgi:4-aminobutyrate aminotransferase-like enzyme
VRRRRPYLRALLEQGIIALPAGPSVIRLLPPLVMADHEADQMLDAIETVLGDGGTPGGR